MERFYQCVRPLNRPIDYARLERSAETLFSIEQIVQAVTLILLRSTILKRVFPLIKHFYT